MKKEITYKQAFAALELLVEKLEDGGIDLEKLAATIQQANGLIEICEKKLRKVTAQAAAATNAGGTVQ